MDRGEQFVAGLYGGVGNLRRQGVTDFTKHAHIRVHAQKSHHRAGKRVGGTGWRFTVVNTLE